MPGFINRLSQRHRRRPAFTLVELLVAMVIAGIISGMLAIALTGAQKQALETRGQAFVDRLNLTMLQLYEDEASRSTGAPISTPQPGSSAANQNASKSRSLSMLNWKRDYLRCALPDRIQDLVDPPIDVYYRIYRGSGNILLARMDPVYEPPIPMPPASPAPPPAWSSVYTASVRWRAQERYKQRVVSILQAVSPTPPASFADCIDGSAANGEWTRQYQAAECLYLILATNTINGVPAAESLRSRDIGDLDKDGIPEVLDPWGTPLGYLRWPCGLHLIPQWNQSTVTPTELAARKIDLQKDALDLLYSDMRFDDTSTTDFQADDPFTLFPMVISAGGDRVFDMVGLDTPPVPAISYASGTFPFAPTGTLGYPGTPRFIDPYQYGVPPKDQLGARQDTQESGIDNSADNILPSFDFS